MENILFVCEISKVNDLFCSKKLFFVKKTKT